jgi:hypothetical protein
MSSIWPVRKPPRIVTFQSAWFRIGLAFMSLMLIGNRAAMAEETLAADSFQACAADPTPTCLLPMFLNEVAKVDDGSPEASVRSTSVLLFLIALTSTDDTDGALSLINAHPNGNEPYRGREADFARAYARSGQEEAAFALADGTEDAMERSYVLSMIAQGQAETGQLTKAAATAAIITEPGFRVTALAAIGDFEAAGALINQLPDELLDDQKSWGLKALAIALARDGQIEAAQLVLDQISGNYFRSDVIVQIARAQAVAGLVPDAIKTAQDAEPGVKPQTELLLSLWHINPDPLFVTALRDLLDRTPPGHRHRRFVLVAMSIVDPAPEYAVEAAAILAATDRDSGEAYDYYDGDLTLLCAAGHYPDALAFALGYRPENLGIRLFSLGRVALCLAGDRLPD